MKPILTKQLMGKGDISSILVNLDDDLGEKINLIQEKPEQTLKLKRLHDQWSTDTGLR